MVAGRPVYAPLNYMQEEKGKNVLNKESDLQILHFTYVLICFQCNFDLLMGIHYNILCIKFKTHFNPQICFHQKGSQPFCSLAFVNRSHKHQAIVLSALFKGQSEKEQKQWGKGKPWETQTIPKPFWAFRGQVIIVFYLSAKTNTLRREQYGASQSRKDFIHWFKITGTDRATLHQRVSFVVFPVHLKALKLLRKLSR